VGYVATLKVKTMPFSKDKPYNELPLLPPTAPLETKSILKTAVSAHRQLAELKGIANVMPNPAILVNAITLQEARSSSEIERVRVGSAFVT
jgi:Fic family protein